MLDNNFKVRMKVILEKIDRYSKWHWGGTSFKIEGNKVIINMKVNNVSQPFWKNFDLYTRLLKGAMLILEEGFSLEYELRIRDLDISSSIKNIDIYEAKILFDSFGSYPLPETFSEKVRVALTRTQLWSKIIVFTEEKLDKYLKDKYDVGVKILTPCYGYGRRTFLDCADKRKAKKWKEATKDTFFSSLDTSKSKYKAFYDDYSNILRYKWYLEGDLNNFRRTEEYGFILTESPETTTYPDPIPGRSGMESLLDKLESVGIDVADLREDLRVMIQ